MNWREDYRRKVMSADEAVKLVKSGERWATTHATAESLVLAEALCRRADELEGVQLWQGLNWGDAPYCDPKYHGHLDVDTIFCGPVTRMATSDGRGQFCPMSVSLIDRAMATTRPVDGLLAHVTPPDEHGYCNLGVSVDFGASAIAHGKKIIAHVNKNMPWVYGNYNTIHVSQIDAIVEEDVPLLNIPPIDDTDPTSSKIGEFIAELIPDGACLQMGQGKVPNAILKCLGDKKDLGIHTEVFSDNLLPLIESGVVNGRRKTLDRGKITAMFIQGSADLYKFVDRNVMINMMPGWYTNSPINIAQNDNVCAINACLQVDLTGQVNCEWNNGRIFSGVGGQSDFLRGAAYSKGGKPILCLPSTAKGETISRIVPLLPPGVPVSTARIDVHWVVTEYGAVNLFGLGLRERGEALISIAHPKFRDQLQNEFDEFWRGMKL
ncbi:acetyl-CoA hydrolase/transferase C-terminal domain-containing protein [Pseudoflavonifractor phocaeensis]|uniref:acetyl-CoA hydrolase/transferase family protein n=1 Tax=Pseudoflavonifractor phocaeensis TaxID=1870988 RepID=UPI00313D2BF1